MELTSNRDTLDWTEAATEGVVYKKMFFKSTQISQKNSCVEFLFNKVAALGVCSFIKKRLESTCFNEHLQTTVSDYSRQRDFFSMSRGVIKTHSNNFAGSF